MSLSRRELLAAGAATALPAIKAPNKPLTFGVIADLHFGLMPKAEERLEAFVAAALVRKPDFIVQLGDFCHSKKPESKDLMRIWRQWKGPAHHVLGNHDMDLGTKKHALDLWEMPAPYYSFDLEAFHFVVIDSNHLHRDGRFIDMENSNWYVPNSGGMWVSTEHLKWLAADIDRTKKPTILFTHQGLDQPTFGGGCQNREQVRDVISKANKRAGWDKVVGVFGGHHHCDFHSVIDTVHHFQVNSASYLWRSGIVPYRDPLFTFVTLDPAGVITVEPCSGEWRDDVDDEQKAFARTAKLMPYISERRVTFRPR